MECNVKANLNVTRGGEWEKGEEGLNDKQEGCEKCDNYHLFAGYSHD